jgi:uncharacterized protein YegP (UPF0339 family)
MKIVITRKGIFKQKWSFKLVARNGKILANSEKYNNHVDMVNAIDIIRNEIATCTVINEYL